MPIFMRRLWIALKCWRAASNSEPTYLWRRYRNTRTRTANNEKMVVSETAVPRRIECAWEQNTSQAPLQHVLGLVHKLRKRVRNPRTLATHGERPISNLLPYNSRCRGDAGLLVHVHEPLLPSCHDAGSVVDDAHVLFVVTAQPTHTQALRFSVAREQELAARKDFDLGDGRVVLEVDLYVRECVCRALEVSSAWCPRHGTETRMRICTTTTR